MDERKAETARRVYQRQRDWLARLGVSRQAVVAWARENGVHCNNGTLLGWYVLAQYERAHPGPVVLATANDR